MAAYIMMRKRRTVVSVGLTSFYELVVINKQNINEFNLVFCQSYHTIGDVLFQENFPMIENFIFDFIYSSQYNNKKRGRFDEKARRRNSKTEQRSARVGSDAVESLVGSDGSPLPAAERCQRTHSFPMGGRALCAACV